MSTNRYVHLMPTSRYILMSTNRYILITIHGFVREDTVQCLYIFQTKHLDVYGLTVYMKYMKGCACTCNNVSLSTDVLCLPSLIKKGMLVDTYINMHTKLINDSTCLSSLKVCELHNWLYIMYTYSPKVPA